MLKAIVAAHVVAGGLALVGGYAALFARKGGSLHRGAGTLFVYSMLVMGIGAFIAELYRGSATWLGGPFTAYLVLTAVAAVRREPWGPDVHLLFTVAAGTFFVGFAALAAVAVAKGGVYRDVPAPGFIINAAAALCAVVGDVRIRRNGPLAGTPRVARHLWRMCFAAFTASGSFFLGQARVIPEPLRIMPLLGLLAALPLLVMVYWLWRLRRKPHQSRIALRLDAAARTVMAILAMVVVAGAASAQSLERAEQAFAMGRLSDARTALQALQRANLSDARVAYYLGRIAVMESDDEFAIQQLEQAVRLDSTNAEHRYWLGRALFEAATRANKVKMYGMARRVRTEWERAVLADPEHLEARASLAAYYAMAPGFMGGGTAKALEQVKQVSVRNAFRGALARGSVAQHDKDWDAEIDAYERAISLRPDTIAGYVALADAYGRTGKLEEAIGTLRRYSPRRPGDAWVHYFTGRLAASTGKLLDEGASALEAFLRAPPADTNALTVSRVHHMLGRIAEHRGTKEAARAHYEAALQSNPRNQVSIRALQRVR